MAVYTILNREDIEIILKDYHLTLKSFFKIKTGILNTNYYLDCNEGKFVLRVFEGGRDFQEENQELEFLLLLKEIIPCCTPVKNIFKENYVVFKNKMVALFYFIDGEPIKNIDENLLKEIGKYLGKLHNFSIDKKLVRKSRVDMECYYKKIDFEKINLPEELKNKIKTSYKEIKKIDFSSLPSGIIHNDIFPDNVFIKEDKIVGILDFNEAQTAPFIYDLAIVINYWIRLNSFSEHMERRYIEAFLNEYEKFRKLELLEKEYLDKAILKMTITFILLRLDKFIIQNLTGVFIEDKTYIQLLPLLKD